MNYEPKPLAALWLTLYPSESIRSSEPCHFGMVISKLRSFSGQSLAIELISKLRSDTGLSLGLCKKAALESNGNYELARKYLSEQVPTSGTAQMNPANEGLIALHVDSQSACLLELRCQSDFVALNAEFASIAARIGKLSTKTNLECGAQAEILSLLSYGRNKFKENIVVGENQQLDFDKRANERIGIYIHQRASNSPTVGKAVAVTKLSAVIILDEDKMTNLAAKIAKEIVAIHDRSMDVERLLSSPSAFSSEHTISSLIFDKESDAGVCINLEQFLFKTMRR